MFISNLESLSSDDDETGNPLIPYLLSRSLPHVPQTSRLIDLAKKIQSNLVLFIPLLSKSNSNGALRRERTLARSPSPHMPQSLPLSRCQNRLRRPKLVLFRYLGERKRESLLLLLPPHRFLTQPRFRESVFSWKIPLCSGQIYDSYIEVGQYIHATWF